MDTQVAEVLRFLERRYYRYTQAPVGWPAAMAEYVVLCTIGHGEGGYPPEVLRQAQAHFLQAHPGQRLRPGDEPSAAVGRVLAADSGLAVLLGLYAGSLMKGSDDAQALALVRRAGEVSLSPAIRDQALVAFEIWHNEVFGDGSVLKVGPGVVVAESAGRPERP